LIELLNSHFAKPVLCAGRFISTKFNLKNMCSTPWCFGDCEECEADKKYEQEREEASAECPYRKECNWVATDVKNDRCTTCGKGYTYS
jgi:hypothetical protein